MGQLRLIATARRRNSGILAESTQYNFSAASGVMARVAAMPKARPCQGAAKTSSPLRRGVASTDFGAAANPMFKSGDPGCWMLKQGTFITGFFPDNIQENLDEEVGVFGFPPAEAGSEKYVVGGGDLATMLSDDENTKEVMKMLAESDIGTEAAKTGAYISPHQDFDPSNYPTEIMKTAYNSAAEADAFLFDGSDQMPGEVGAGTFWSEMTSWITGDTDLDTALTNIDESWPAS